MIKGINRIRNFGVFSDYSKPAGTEDFVEKNIIYGWNYSGKTTLSRLFQTLERGCLHSDYLDLKFSITDASGAAITETNVADAGKTVRVFNADFVERNLSWNGISFNPILLLGEDSIEAKKHISESQKIVERCRQSYKTKKLLIAGIEGAISTEKTEEAKKIRTTLSLVETFTATHLNSILTSMQMSEQSHLLDASVVPSMLKLSLTSDNDKLDLLSKFIAKTNLSEIALRAKALIEKQPKLSNTIEYLQEKSDVSDWVETGLGLHAHTENCEFCGSKISLERMAKLEAHFSKDLVNHKIEIEELIKNITLHRLTLPTLATAQVYPQFREQMSSALTVMAQAQHAYNEELDKLAISLRAKQKSPFTSHAAPITTLEAEGGLQNAISKVNHLLEKSNEVTANFGKEKQKALTTLKRHYVANFYFEHKLAMRNAKAERNKRHLIKYKTFGEKINELIKELEAKINLAQKGREEINRRISNLLGSDSIRIDVIKESDNDRFRLMRGDTVAKNLSEGEKTAIAFSFFLTKLSEVPDKKEALVYIDDPISSLDSNHIFQVNALIKEAFFFQDQATGNKWKTTYKQIFISTHNFEFFSLLRDLPCKKKTRYFHVKKISPTVSTFTNLPQSIEKYSSEYHYLFSLIYSFHNSPDKTDLEVLLSIPNAVRRFLELYTYARIPSNVNTSVDDRADILFGTEKSKRILKVLHHFSHLNNIERISKNTDLLCDVENAVSELFHHLKEDPLHFNALMEGV